MPALNSSMLSKCNASKDTLYINFSIEEPGQGVFHCQPPVCSLQQTVEELLRFNTSLTPLSLCFRVCGTDVQERPGRWYLIGLAYALQWQDHAVGLDSDGSLPPASKACQTFPAPVFSSYHTHEELQDRGPGPGLRVGGGLGGRTGRVAPMLAAHSCQKRRQFPHNRAPGPAGDRVVCYPEVPRSPKPRPGRPATRPPGSDGASRNRNSWELSRQPNSAFSAFQTAFTSALNINLSWQRGEQLARSLVAGSESEVPVFKFKRFMNDLFCFPGHCDSALRVASQCSINVVALTVSSDTPPKRPFRKLEPLMISLASYTLKTGDRCTNG
eukprot:g10543.t1